MSLSLTTVCSLTDVLCVTAVMDITDVAHGKTDDEDKQHFIPFQQWVFWCCHTSSSAVYMLNLGLFFFFFQLHNWAEIMGNIWNGTLVLLYLLTAFPRVCSQGCTSNISSGAASQGQIWKPFFFFLQYRVLAFRQRQASRPRFSQHLLTGGGRGR